MKSRLILACLGEASRFRVVLALSKGEMYVSEIASRVGLSQSCTTRHLQALARAGIVSGQRAGKRVVFRLSHDPAIVALIEWASTADRSMLQAMPIERRVSSGKRDLPSSGISLQAGPAGPLPQPSRPVQSRPDSGPDHGGPAPSELEDFLL